MAQARVCEVISTAVYAAVKKCWFCCAFSSALTCWLQNVLLQMGLHVLAVNGMLIREARSYILRCHGCFKYVANNVRPAPLFAHSPLFLNLL